MVTMYEMIMDFPRFKGIGRNRVSSLLERHRIVFNNFNPGDVIGREGDSCDLLRFIIRGRAKVVRTSADGFIRLEYYLEAGSVIGADSLFGWDTSYADTVSCDRTMATLVLNKDQYLAILRSDDIYTLNYLNFLAMHLQLSRTAIGRYGGDDVLSLMARWVLSMTDQYSKDISVRFDRASAEQLECLRRAVAEGVIIENGATFAVPDRRVFLEFADRELGIREG